MEAVQVAMVAGSYDQVLEVVKAVARMPEVVDAVEAVTRANEAVQADREVINMAGNGTSTNEHQ